MTTPKILTTKEFARMAQLETQTLRSYRSRGKLPPPDGFLGNSPYWNLATVKAWIRHKPPIGRPPKEVT